MKNFNLFKYLLIIGFLIVSNAFAEDNAANQTMVATTDDIVVVAEAAEKAAPSETSQPEVVIDAATAAPEITSPEINTSDVSSPEFALPPELVIPEVAKPETSKPETSKPETSKSKEVKSEATKPEVDKREEIKSEATKSEVVPAINKQAEPLITEKVAKKSTVVAPEKKAIKTTKKATTAKKIIAVQPKAPEEQRKNLAGLNEYPAVTALSKKALNLSVGMTRQEVFNLLGRPSWVELQQNGRALVWSWDNDVCNPITVTFNKKLQVVGFDQGRINCLKVKFNYKPEKELLCSNKENDDLCSATSDLSKRTLVPVNLKDVHNKIETKVDEKKTSQLPPIEESKAIDVIDAA